MVAQGGHVWIKEKKTICGPNIGVRTKISRDERTKKSRLVARSTDPTRIKELPPLVVGS
jgi:hypothetical protein